MLETNSQLKSCYCWLNLESSFNPRLSDVSSSNSHNLVRWLWEISDSWISEWVTCLSFWELCHPARMTVEWAGLAKGRSNNMLLQRHILCGVVVFVFTWCIITYSQITLVVGMGLILWYDTPDKLCFRHCLSASYNNVNTNLHPRRSW